MQQCRACRWVLELGSTQSVFSTVDNVGHWIPYGWLMGRTQVHEREGLPIKQAYLASLHEWADECHQDHAR